MQKLLLARNQELNTEMDFLTRVIFVALVLLALLLLPGQVFSASSTASWPDFILSLLLLQGALSLLVMLPLCNRLLAWQMALRQAQEGFTRLLLALWSLVIQRPTGRPLPTLTAVQTVVQMQHLHHVKLTRAPHILRDGHAPFCLFSQAPLLLAP